jgi:acyl CoA:acetate/3-ketoacid CoA transferase beta subunit
MKSPTKKEIECLRLALGMGGAVYINDQAAEIILVTQQRMKQLGGKFSLRDACNITATVQAKYDKIEKEKEKQSV